MLLANILLLNLLIAMFRFVARFGFYSVSATGLLAFCCHDNPHQLTKCFPALFHFLASSAFKFFSRGSRL